MSEANKSEFKFSGFQILKSQIEKTDIEKVVSDLSIDFIPRGELNKGTKKFNLYLEVQISNSEKTFLINIIAVGFFEYSIESGDDKLKNYFYVNAPAILFPYIRAYISTLTNLSGYSPVNLPTINFSFIADTLKRNTKELL